MKIILIGAGNVGTHLGTALSRSGHHIAAIYSRTEAHAQKLANMLDTSWTTALNGFDRDADVYLFAVKDDALPELIRMMPETEGIWVHTAGSLGMQVFEGHKNRYGVFYPLQTFSRERQVDFSQIPLLLEASDSQTYRLLEELAACISKRILEVSGEQRARLHVAAVLACNFTNHLYALSSQVMKQAGLSLDLLHPLIQETTQKAIEHPPESVQTGPAVRYDQKIIQKHTELLSFAPKIREIYKTLTNSIYRMYKSK